MGVRATLLFVIAKCDSHLQTSNISCNNLAQIANKIKNTYADIRTPGNANKFRSGQAKLLQLYIKLN